MTVAVRQAGIDTWSPCWRVDPDSNAALLLDQMATAKTARGSLLPEAVGGHRIGWIKPVGMLYAEGHPSPDGLCRPDRLPAAYEALRAAMDAAEVPHPRGARSCWIDDDGGYAQLDGESGVRRLDATIDLAFDDAVQGAATLTGVAALLRMTGHAQIRADRLGVQTVYLHGRDGKRVLARWYDKGLESGEASRGLLIRPEDQRRYVKNTRRDVSELTPEYVRGQFHRRFMPLYRASKGVLVAGQAGIVRKIADQIESGEVKAPEASTLLGHLMLEQELARRTGRHVGRGPLEAPGELTPQIGVSRATAWRRRKRALELGLVLGDAGLEEVEVDMHEVMERAMDEPVWGGQG